MLIDWHNYPINPSHVNRVSIISNGHLLCRSFRWRRLDIRSRPRKRGYESSRNPNHVRTQWRYWITRPSILRPDPHIKKHWTKTKIARLVRSASSKGADFDPDDFSANHHPLLEYGIDTYNVQTKPSGSKICKTVFDDSLSKVGISRSNGLPQEMAELIRKKSYPHGLLASKCTFPLYLVLHFCSVFRSWDGRYRHCWSHFCRTIESILDSLHPIQPWPWLQSFDV